MKVSAGTIRRWKLHNGTWQWQGVLTITTDEGVCKKRTKQSGIPCEPPSEAERGRGKRSIPVGKGARQALAWMQEWRSEVVDELTADEHEGALSADAQTTVADLLPRYWSTREVTPGTMADYEKMLKYIDRPVLRKPVAELDPADIEAWQGELREEELGQTMRRKVYDQVRYGLRWAVDMEMIDKSPCDKTTPPRRPTTEPHPLDKENAQRLRDFLEHAASAPSTAIIADAALLALLTGMRRGEICGLTWNAVDDDFIHVTQVVSRKPGGWWVKPFTKNGQRRDIPLNGEIRAVLERRRKALEDSYSDLSGGYVFGATHSADMHPTPTTLIRSWSTLAALSGAVTVDGKPPRFHDLRDTWATLALTSGIDVLTVASILGHKNTSTTFKHYGRWLPNANSDAMARMGEVLASQSGS